MTLRNSMAGLVALAVATAWTTPASAQFDPITDRDYSIDLYQGTVLGSVRIIGMGGAAVAIARGSAYLFANPASPAVRPATSNDTWDWDWHLDWLNPGLGSDPDNNGLEVKEESRIFPLVTMGLVGQYKHWGLGVNVELQQRQLTIPGDVIEPTFAVGQVSLAREFDPFTIGISIRTGQFTMDSVRDTVETTLFAISGEALEVGGLWRPRDRDVRVGITASLPITGIDEDIADQIECNPLDCAGYILPETIEVPWRLAAGVAWRRAPTRWNRSIDKRWRDERYLLLAADLVMFGPVADGHGIEGFLRQELQPSGESASLSVRAGAEYEWIPGKLRIRAGSYWEPGRFQGRAGRVHGTVGLDVRVWAFCLWGQRYRARLSLTGDFAENYGNTGVSLGLWN